MHSLWVRGSVGQAEGTFHGSRWLGEGRPVVVRNRMKSRTRQGRLEHGVLLRSMSISSVSLATCMKAKSYVDISLPTSSTLIYLYGPQSGDEKAASETIAAITITIQYFPRAKVFKGGTNYEIHSTVLVTCGSVIG